MNALDYYNRALKFDNKGDQKKALEMYRMALKSNPQFSDSWLNAGAIYAKQGKSEKAIVCYQRAIKSNADKRAYYNLASEYFKVGNYKDARKLLKDTILVDKLFLQAHLLLGYTYGKLGENQNAEASIKKVLESDPANKPAMVALALLFFHSKRYEESLYYVDKILGVNPNDSGVQKLRASLKLETGDINESLSSYKKVIKNDKKVLEMYDILNKGKLKAKRKEIKKKRSGLESKNTKSAKDWFDLSFLTLFDGQAEKAIEYLQNAMAIKSENMTG